ncbi:unnamed protein product [Closterium sp. Naga37s-1]|nr:unnamed protein product [Closterium sp. Naga37s-1]
MALSAVLANESTIVNQFAPSLAQLLGGTEVQLCSLFVGFHDCSNDFEQVGCAINCNPDSGNYVRQSEGVGANPIFTMCDSFATKMFDDCKGLPVPGTGATFGQFLNSKERMLNKSFGAIFSALGYRSTSLEIAPVSSVRVLGRNRSGGGWGGGQRGGGRSGRMEGCVVSKASLVRRLFQGFSGSRKFPERSAHPTQSTRSTHSARSTRSTRPARPSAQSAHFGKLTNPEADSVQAQFEKDKIVIMRIAVVGGTGNVGSKLAQKLCAAGHDVVLTSRHPGDEKTAKALAYVKEGGKGAATAAGVAEAVEGADAVIVATPGYATAEEWSKVVVPFSSYAGVVLDASNPLTAWPGLEISADQTKRLTCSSLPSLSLPPSFFSFSSVVAPFASYTGVVLDASNPLSAWPGLEISVDHRTTSGAEELKKALPNAHVYKAFNSVGAELMVTPTLGGKPIAMLFAGSEDAGAKETASKIISAVGFRPEYVISAVGNRPEYVGPLLLNYQPPHAHMHPPIMPCLPPSLALGQIISAVGFRPEYVGPLRNARNLESLAELWVHLAIKQGWARDGFAFDIHKA